MSSSSTTTTTSTSNTTQLNDESTEIIQLRDTTNISLPEWLQHDDLFFSNP